MTRVFVSHAHDDRGLVEPFVDELVQLGSKVGPERIFYSSGADTGVRAGGLLNEELRESIRSAGIVIAVVSPAYLTRPYCVAELGAAWVLGRLHPVTVPGISGPDLAGVLDGLVVGSIDDSRSLDLLNEAICAALGIAMNTVTWGSHKAKWLSRLTDRLGHVAAPRTARIEDLDQARGDLESAYRALRAGQDEIVERDRTIAELMEAKDADEVAAIMLPTDEVAAFQELRRDVVGKLRALPHIVRDAVWFVRFERGMPWPREHSDEVDDALRAGWLVEAYSEEELLVLSDDFDETRQASESVARLAKYLDSDDRTPGFDPWFRAEHDGMPPKLRNKRLWDALF